MSTKQHWLWCLCLGSLVWYTTSLPTVTMEECLALKTRLEKDLVRELRASRSNIVQKGSVEFGFIGDEELLDCERNNCAFTNPKSPYGMTILPLSPEEDLEEKSEASSTPLWAQNNLDAEWGPGNSPVWQLRFDEVVVVLACTPSPEISRYFSFTGYLFDIYNKAEKKWVSSFGSLQDSLSIFRSEEGMTGIENRLKTAAVVGTRTQAYQNEQTSAFNKLTVVLMGASKTSVARVEERVQRALQTYQMDDLINKIVISEPFAQEVGLEPYDSYYALIVRNIVPDGQLEAFKSYAETKPLMAWRLTPKREISKQKKDLFALPVTIPRQLPFDNAESFEAAYAEGLEALISEIERKNIKKNVVAHALGSGSSLGLMGIDKGLDCVERFVDLCNGDNRDAQYLSTYPLMLLDNDEKFAYVVGVNHNVVGLTVYNNIAVSDPERKLGIQSVDDEEMIGSADKWLKGTPFEETSSNYYAIRFSRNCRGSRFVQSPFLTMLSIGEKYCVEIPVEGPRAVPYDQQILVNSRLYVNLETGVGPSEEDIVMPHMMIFTPKKNHTKFDVRERVPRKLLEESPCMPAFLSLTVCVEGISADCCNGVVSWTENNCFCNQIGTLLLDTLPKGFGEQGLRALSMICGKLPSQCV